MASYTPRLKTVYHDDVAPTLRKQFSLDNVMEIPRLQKIVVNKGVGDAVANKKSLTDAVEQVRMISGQQPVTVGAKKSVSNFKLRQGMPIGVYVTLRGDRMWDFLDRLISLALPRVRDFRGIPDKSFDGRGNYSLGIKEQIIFPEINIDKIDKIDGMDITFVTSAPTDEQALALLKGLGMPFVRREEDANVEGEAQ
jgi:large subunit ribosomal protein L5